MNYFVPTHQDSSEDSSNRNYNNLSDNTGAKPKIKRCSASRRISRSVNNIQCSTNSDSSNSSNYNEHCSRSYNLTKSKHDFKSNELPPLGIYWDIENCRVPRNKSTTAAVQRIRQLFLEYYREFEFVVVCDVKKETCQVIQELHNAQVMVIHVSAIAKNAADDKLRQSLRRFGELNSPPACVVLISSDINFAADLSELRYRKKMRVVLIHSVNVSDALVLCANEHYYFVDIMIDLPTFRSHDYYELRNEPVLLTISNLPTTVDVVRLKQRLRMVTSNCGGQVRKIRSFDGTATIKYTSLDDAIRAQGRIQGENVYGHRINVSPTIRNYAGRKIYPEYSENRPTPPPPGFMQDCQSIFFNEANTIQNKISIQNPSNQQVQRLVDACAFKPIRGASPSEAVCENPWRRRTEPRCITPQDQLLAAVSGNSQPPPRLRSHKSSGSSEQANEEHGVSHSSETDSRNAAGNQPVDLIVSNLDPNIEPKELKRLLKNMLKEHASILSVNVTVQNDGAPVANIKVNGQREAQFTISQLCRKRLGHKRIAISYAQTASPFSEELKVMAVELLQEVPDKCMPLFQFLNLLESRYQCTASLSEVNKLKDVCKISNYLGSRIISLNQNMTASPSPNFPRTFVQYCTTHCPNEIQSRGWSEFSTNQTPNIKIPLTVFANKLVTLLKAHMGVMHLLSFQACYEQEFHEPLPINNNGVPLEHLVTCVPRIEISLVGPNKNIKVIRHDEENTLEHEELSKTVNTQLSAQVSLLCRELIDLLKTQHKCQLLMSKLIPAYHHHFGRQCRVSDYGYTKLVDLIESIPHIIQILGDGTGRTITLSHFVQMRRFTSDLLRVLKLQPAKQVSLRDFPSAYEKAINRPFDAVEYGLCSLEDLLQQVSGNSATVYRNEAGEYLVSLPKREQTSEEITKTKQFAAEVMDLLRHAPHYTIHFNKFIPAYHRHFGHQCKVSYYGFTKLKDLFDAISHVVKIQELPNGERTVSLTNLQALKVLGIQIVQLIKSSPRSSLPLMDLPKTFLAEFGYPLKPSLYDCDSISEVVTQLSDYVQIINNHDNVISLIAIDVDTSPDVLTIRCWALLLKPPHYANLTSFRYEYRSRYNSNFTMDGLLQIGHAISVSPSDELNYVCLTSLYTLAAELYHVVHANDGNAPYADLEKSYLDYYGKELKLSSHQIFSADDFHRHFNLIFFVRFRKEKSVVVLNRSLGDHFVPLPPSVFKYGDAIGTNEWPAPPSLEMLSKNLKSSCPPIPSTPTQQLVPDGDLWNSPFDNLLNLSIQAPYAQNPRPSSHPDLTISPARHLLPPMDYLWNSSLSSIPSPHPTEVPMPVKLMFKGGAVDDTADSGVNIKLDDSPSDNENEASSSSTTNRCENGKRPCAKF